MDASTFTAFESALMVEFFNLYESAGFPPPQSLSVALRENKGAGRYVTLNCSTPCFINDGYLDLGGKYIEMAGVPPGMMAVILVKDGRPKEMEIAVYDSYAWDGNEFQWSIK